MERYSRGMKVPTREVSPGLGGSIQPLDLPVQCAQYSGGYGTQVWTVFYPSNIGCT